jgi:VWFA-related protein
VTRRSCAAALALAAAIAVVAFGTRTADAQQHTFRSGVDVVRVDVLVTNGRIGITGLKPGDFELRDNGVLQTIDTIARESLPLTVTFVIDTSGSVAGRKMQHLGSAVDLVLQGLRAQDRVGLVTFSHRIWQRMPLTADVEPIRRILTATEAAGGTALNDAVYTGLALSESQDARTLVLVFSDGLDNASWLDDETVERAARRADAVVYGVAVGASTTTVYQSSDRGATSQERPDYVRGQTAFLETIASATGGRVIRADTTDNLPKAFDEILQEFRTRYLLTYSPRGVDTPGWHAIDVKIKGRRADVRARRGYERGF